MERPVAGEVVVVPFPHADLTGVKRRPALVLVPLRGEDVILCQITSQARFDGYSIPLASSDFASGGLPLASHVRPNRLFTAHQSVLLRSVGLLQTAKRDEVLEQVRSLFVAQKSSQ